MYSVMLLSYHEQNSVICWNTCVTKDNMLNKTIHKLEAKYYTFSYVQENTLNPKLRRKHWLFESVQDMERADGERVVNYKSSRTGHE